MTDKVLVTGVVVGTVNDSCDNIQSSILLYHVMDNILSLSNGYSVLYL